jgi:hypothetical protein
MGKDRLAVFLQRHQILQRVDTGLQTGARLFRIPTGKFDAPQDTPSKTNTWWYRNFLFYSGCALSGL